MGTLNFREIALYPAMTVFSVLYKKKVNNKGFPREFSLLFLCLYYTLIVVSCSGCE